MKGIEEAKPLLDWGKGRVSGGCVRFLEFLQYMFCRVETCVSLVFSFSVLFISGTSVTSALPTFGSLITLLIE